MEDKNNCQEVQEYRQCSWWGSMLRWVPSSFAALANVEKKMLASVWDKLEEKFVMIENGSKHIRTITMNKQSPNSPLVLVHGMGAGVGLWINNLEVLSKNRPVYAIDLLGFGRSTRPKFSNDAMLAEMEFVESIEQWRKEEKLEKFILLGHSLGGFIVSSYAIRYPDRIQHLILADPWGFPEKPPESRNRTQVPGWVKVIAMVLQPFNPLAALRAAGPWGPGLVAKFRPDLTRKFQHLFEDDTVSNYIFHCNAQTPSGETAFKNMTIPFGWAKYPMIRRIEEIPAYVPITMLYGSRSWMDAGIGHQVKYIRHDSFVDIQIIRGAGHHVYVDKAEMFNLLVNRVGDVVDRRANPGMKRIATSRGRLQSESLHDRPHKKPQRSFMRSYSESRFDPLEEEEKSEAGEGPSSIIVEDSSDSEEGEKEGGDVSSAGGSGRTV